MDKTFIKTISDKISSQHQTCRTNTREKIVKMRSVFLELNREKYKQFSFAEKDRKFWRIAAFKVAEFECDMNEIICTTKRLLEIAKQGNSRGRITEIQKRINYYGLVLKTLRKYDKNYGENLGLILNRLFCKDISHYIRDFI
jgi:hypothetical protein